ncbi:MAG: glycosyltransferase family 4 protein [Thermoanaerobaculia bacterium]
MAGVGIRFWEMARHLGPRYNVTLAIPNAPEECPPLTAAKVVRYGESNIAELARSADAVIVHGHISNFYFAQGISRPLVVDLYDPFPIENLNYFPELGDEPYRYDRLTIERQLRHGDLFLCSSAEQRLFYLGMLYTLGRLTPQTYFDDFELANLVREVPFGISTGEPGPEFPEPTARPAAPVLRGVIDGIGEDDPVILFGGIYDWYDPMLLVRALPELITRFPALRVVFSANPNPESTPQALYAEVRAECEKRNWLNRHVFFVPWVPPDRRRALYAESTIAVVLHRARFETELSMRTRILDFLGAGLPTVATAGGAVSRMLIGNEMGVVVPAGDATEVVVAVTRLLESESLRRELANRGKLWGAGQTWEAVLRPVVEFLDAPRTDPQKYLYAAGPLAEENARAGLAGRLKRKLRRLL